MKTYLMIALCLCFACVVQAKKPKLADAPRAYVTNSLNNTVSVIDTETNTLIATIPVGIDPVCVVAGAKFAYVGNIQGNTVSVIDRDTNTVTHTINLLVVAGGDSAEGWPSSLALSPDETVLYVADGHSGLVEVNTATNTVINCGCGIFDGGYGIFSRPVAVTVTANGSVYIIDFQFQLMALNAKTDTFASIPPTTAGLMATSASTLYVGHGGMFLAINTDTNTVTKTIAAPAGVGGGEGLAVSPDGRTIYTTNSTNTVSVINVASGKVTHTIPVGKTPEGIAVDAKGSVYVVNSADNSVSVIDPERDIVTAVISVGSGAGQIAIH